MEAMRRGPRLEIGKLEVGMGFSCYSLIFHGLYSVLRAGAKKKLVPQSRGPRGQVLVRGVESRGPRGQVLVRGVESRGPHGRA
jgi:hypothetical protein